MVTVKDLPNASNLSILIIEDSPARISIFHNVLRKHNVFVCKTAKVAYEVFPSHKWDVIFFDHDLADVHYGAPMESESRFLEWKAKNPGVPDTGYDVAVRVSADISPKALVVTHSLNPLGRERIKRVIPHCIEAPFDKLVLAWQ